MPGPTLSAAETAQVTKEAAKAVEAAATFTAQIAAQQTRAAELGVVDGAYKKFFQYYNDNIIAKYDAERLAINGRYIAAPITEADIVNAGNLSGRLVPSLPVTDIIRIPEFDGGPLLVNNANELQFISDQSIPEDVLVNGYGAVVYAMTTTTSTAITPSSTTLSLTDSAAAISIAANSVAVISTLSDLAVVKFLTVTPGTEVAAPFTATCTIQLIVPPTSSVASGSSLTAFTGFTNSERTTKTPVLPALQPLMDYLVLQLQNAINLRIPKLNAQLAALAANQEPTPGIEISTAITNATISKSFLNNYLLTTDVSNTGLTQLSTERASRTTYANTRITQITAAYTTKPTNYFNKRYEFANNRANTSRGSLRLQAAAAAGATTSAAFASTLTDQAGSLNSLL